MTKAQRKCLSKAALVIVVGLTIGLPAMIVLANAADIAVANSGPQQLCTYGSDD